MTIIQLKDFINCENFPCGDINKKGYYIPPIEIEPSKINIIMIAEALPENSKDYFYSEEDPEFMKTTLQAFKDAELSVESINDILNLGFYLTTAVKCSKTGYSVPTAAIKNCSYILAKELEIFPNIRVIMLMGDVAIRALNYISKRQIGERVIPSGSTYKIRHNEFYYKDIRVFPSYLMTGKNYLIEKSKRRMIAEDIKNALENIHFE